MNKKILINCIATILLALICSQFLPWYGIMIAAFATAFFMPLKKAAVFFSPFVAITLFWMGYAYVVSSTNNFILAEKISVLLNLGGNPYLLLLITGIIGGLAAGFAALFGKQLINLVKN
ncbi:hypothetical protein KH5_12450 [Urechidicola sp. KH5]